jgi:hypothetical protein
VALAWVYILRRPYTSESPHHVMAHHSVKIGGADSDVVVGNVGVSS